MTAVCTTHHHACACREAAHAVEVQALHDRIAEAAAVLNGAPDPANGLSKREAAAIQAANLKAWTILAADRDPPGTGHKGQPHHEHLA